MKLSCAGIRDRAAWEQAGIRLPSFHWEAMRAGTEQATASVHLCAGNIYPAFIAKHQQD